ncbi:MAG: aromatic acid exporter family protein [Turicibacter sp.]|nr:aromatic acid exporter family protein [Turicibacter sp.]
MNIQQTINKIKDYSPISIGMRTFKTWIAATLTAMAALTPIIGNPFYALMGTVFSMQATVASSFKMGFGRVIGTAIGAFIGFIFAYFELNSPLSIGLAIALVIIICGLFNIKHSILITVTLCLLIMFNPDREGGLFHYAFFRTLDTAFGVVIGFLVNRFIAPPNHLKALQLELATIYKLAKEVLTDHKKLPALKKELNTLALIHTNYQADEKYDNHDVSNENLRNMVEACHYLCFHFQHYKDSDTTIKNYHTANIYKTLALLEKTIAELKGAI